MPLVWREQMSVGNNMIDEDHRRLIDIINQVEESLAVNDRYKLTRMFGRLSKYAEEHFAREEALARKVGYDGVTHLHEEHAGLMKNLAKYRESAIGGDWDEGEIDEFCELLRAWLMDHVFNEDMKMKPTMERFPKFYKPD